MHPVTHSASCSAAYANENIQNPDMNNTELVTFRDHSVAHKATKKIYQYEEVGHE